MFHTRRRYLALAILLHALATGAAWAGRVTLLEPTGPQPSVVSPNGRAKMLYEESHALLISASGYSGASKGGWQALPHTATEMDSVAEALRPHGFAVTRVHDPTGDELVQVFRQFVARHGHKRDVRLFVFFSGHGYTNPLNDFGYVVPVDARDPQTDRTDFFLKALPIQQVELWAREITSRHALFVFDSCFSGTIFSTRAGGSLPEPLGSDPSDRWRFLQGPAQEPVRQFISAGSATEVLPGRSSFVPLVLRALRHGVPNQPDGYLTGKGLGQWIEQQLPTLTGGRQNPQSGVIRDAALALGDMVFQMPGDANLLRAPGSQVRPPVLPAAVLPRLGHCDRLEFDVETGLLSGLPPNLSKEEVKRELPCFTGETGEGEIANYGGGVFFLNHDFFFYTFLRYLEIRSDFSGRTSIPLFGRSRAELRRALPFAERSDRPYWASDRQEFVARPWGCLMLEFKAGDQLGTVRAFVVKCDRLRQSE